MTKLKKGLVQIYTGNGKGKTTAAFGLALRAVGAGMKVYIQQFMKGMPYSELNAFGRISGITCVQCGTRCFVKGNPAQKDIDCARKGLFLARRQMLSGKYDIVILDELNVAIDIELVGFKEVVSLIEGKPSGVELVLTGRNCPKKLYAYADLVSEIKDIKHPYRKGIKARRGIEH